MAGKIIITPNNGSTTAGQDPTIKFQGTGNSTDITLRTTSDGSLSFEGTVGQLLSISDSMSGTIHSVNDISGIPSIEVLDTGLVKLAQYSGNVVVGSAVDNNIDKLQVNGSVSGNVLKSTIATGTAPLIVNSTTIVNNLNASMVGGLSVATGINVLGNQIVRTDPNGHLHTNYIHSSAGNENNATSPYRIWGTNGIDSYLRTYQTASLNAGSANVLYTARTINGVPFNGSANIVVADSTKVPLNGASYVQSIGLATYWGNTGNGNNTGSFNSVMGTSDSATWLLSGTSGGVFRAGIQALDSTGALRFYQGGNSFHYSDGTLTATTFSGALSGNATTATKLANIRTINDVAFDGSSNIKITEWTHSGRDFPAGTKISTSINYANIEGDPFILEIRGNSYNAGTPFDIQCQGYIWDNTIINHGGVSNGSSIPGIVALNVGGFLTFWFPSGGYWQGFNVRVYNANSGGNINRVTSIDNGTKPVGTKEVNISANIRQSWHSGNLNNLNQLTNGPGYTTNVGTLTSVTATGPVVSSGGTAPVISMPAATTSVAGHLTAANWNTFNNKQPAGAYLIRDAAGNVGLDVTPSGWGSIAKAVEIVSGAAVVGFSGNAVLASNSYYNGTNWIYKSAGAATRYESNEGATGNHAWFNAPVGSAGTSATFNRTMTLDTYGVLKLGFNTVLHSANYSSYALPLSGGTLTGAITTVSSGTALNFSGQTDSLGYNAVTGLGTYIKGTSSTYLYGGGIFFDGAVRRTLLHEGNYNSYSPTLTGGNASGTWNINVSGNAATATTATSTSLLSSLANYAWSAATLPTGYPLGIQSSHVQGANGFPNYGSVVNVGTYAAGGGALQLYTPYSPSYGGTGLQVRFGNYDVNSGNSWTSWKTLLASDNFNSYSPTLTGTGASGTWNINVSGNAGSATVSGMLSPNQSLTYNVNGLQYFNINGAAGDVANQNSLPTNDWNHIIRMNHGNTDGYYTDIASSFHSDAIHYRRIEGGITKGWVKFWDSRNLTNLNQLTNGPGYTTNVGTVTGVTATGPVVSSGGTAPVISMPAATTSVAGHLTAANWNTFNNKANTSSPAFSGTPTAPTATFGNVTTQVATTAFVQAAINSVANGVVTISPSITLSTSWQDVGVAGGQLATGSYMVQVYVHDFGQGGGQYNSYYTGMMSWFAGGTNSNEFSEITLHSAGHAFNQNTIFLRTLLSSGGFLKLQIAGTSNNSSASTYAFKFKQLI